MGKSRSQHGVHEVSALKISGPENQAVAEYEKYPPFTISASEERVSRMLEEEEVDSIM